MAWNQNDVREVVTLAKEWGESIARRDSAEKSGDTRAAIAAWDSLYEAERTLNLKLAEMGLKS